MQITPHIHALRIPFKVQVSPVLAVSRFVYVFLICGRRMALIDTGVAGSETVIFDYIKTIGRDPGEIATMILTHSHADHIGAAKAVQEKTGCAVAASPLERAWIEDIDLQARERPVPGFHALVAGGVRVDRELNDGDQVDLDDGLTLHILHTPGHSPGSLSLLLPGERALFCGDAVLVPGDMPVYDDALVAAKSVRRLRAVRDIDVLLSSWDAPQRGEHVYQRMEESLDYLQRIHTSVIRLSDRHHNPGSEDFCKLILTDLDLPERMFNPLVMRSIASNLRFLRQPVL